MQFNQQCSSRKMSVCIIEKHDRWDGWRYYWRQRYRSQDLWAFRPANLPEKCENIGWNMKQVLFDIVMKIIFRTWCSTSQHRKDRNFSRKCTTSFICRQKHNGEIFNRSRLCFSPSQTYVKCFTCGLMCADTTKCAHFLVRKGIFDWKHALTPEEPWAFNETNRCHNYI